MTTAPRSALAALALAWLAVLVQPCAMAMDIDAGCPHCPPGSMSDMHPGPGHAHHGAHGDAAVNHGAGHAHHAAHGKADAAGAKPACGTSQADCDTLDDASVDGRTVKAKPQSAVDAPLAGADMLERTYRVATLHWAPPRPVPPGTPPPRHRLLCVYLN